MKTITQIDLLRILQEKSPRLARILPGFVVNWLRRLLRVDDLNITLRNVGAIRKENSNDYTDADARTFNKDVLAQLGVNVRVIGYIPGSGRNIFVANHPLGAVDGMAFIDVVSLTNTQVRFPVNDILVHALPNFRPIFMPINKHGAQGREFAVEFAKVGESDAQILYFPAGLVSRKINGEIKDLEWHDSIIRQAVKYKRNIVPVYIDGQNSARFYRWARWGKLFSLPRIAMLLLPDEAYRQKGKTITFVMGKPIPWEHLAVRDPKWAIITLRQKCYDLKKTLIKEKSQTKEKLGPKKNSLSPLPENFWSGN